MADRLMHALLGFLAMLAVIIGAATLSGCQSYYRTDASGQRYHVGDEWSAYRFDRNFTPHRVK